MVNVRRIDRATGAGSGAVGAAVVVVVWAALLASTHSLAAQGLRAVPPETGTPVGMRIPDFQAVDQNGNLRTFADIRGPRGVLLMFVRSADW